MALLSTYIPILMYHQIDIIPPKVDAQGERSKFRSLTVSPTSFARQMRLLNFLGYRGVSMTELMPYLRGEKRGNVVGITFDDGYQNNFTHALPVLKRYGFTSTCYVVSGLIGKTNAWDEPMGVASQALMSAKELRAWRAGGQEIGSHTVNHANLKNLNPASARDEITNSKYALQDLTGADCAHFCYPYGEFDQSHAAMARQAGYATATTTRRARASSSHDPYLLPRVGVLKNTSLLRFWFEVTR